MSKAPIPTVHTGRPDLDQALAAMKRNLDEIGGQLRGREPLQPLPSTASLTDVINRLNEVIARLQ